MSQMLREIVRSLVAGEPDLELVGELADARALADTVCRCGPDVVVGHSTPSEIQRLLEQRPTMKILQVENNGRSSFLYELRPHRIPLGELSRARLLEVLRT
jgi:hypothetical protein